MRKSFKEKLRLEGFLESHSESGLMGLGRMEWVVGATVAGGYEHNVLTENSQIVSMDLPVQDLIVMIHGWWRDPGRLAELWRTPFGENLWMVFLHWNPASSV